MSHAEQRTCRHAAHRALSLRSIAALACAAVPAFMPAGVGAQNVAECGAAAGRCLAECALAGGLGTLLGGGSLKPVLADCRKSCEAQRLQCQSGQAAVAPAEALPASRDGAGPPAPSGLPRTPAGQPPAAGNPAAARGHVHPLREVTTAPGIVPVRVPVYEGAAVIGYSFLADTSKSRPTYNAYREGDSEALRWFTLMQLAARPALLDNPLLARRVAALFLPAREWDEYLDCANPKGCAFALQSLDNTGAQSRAGMQALQMKLAYANEWKGANEFERPRSHKAFVAKYGALLRAQAPALPQDMIFMTRGNFGPYSAKDGLLPFSADLINPAMLSLPLANGYCAPTSVVWPAGIAASPAVAEALIGGLKDANRRAYLAVRMKVSAVDATTVGMSTDRPATTHCRSEAQITALTLYADEALTRKIHTFIVPRAVPPPASRTSAAPVPWQVNVAGALAAPAETPQDTQHEPAARSPSSSPSSGAHVHPYRQMTTAPDIVPVRVPVFEAVPVIGYATLTDGKSRPIQMAYLDGDLEVSRWFILMQLAARPTLLDDARQALSAAALFVPPQLWDDYFDCGLDKGCAYGMEITAKSQRRIGREGLRGRLLLARDWKGSNEFERPRSHKAFVAKYGATLRSQAAALPQDVILVARGQFSEYSAKDAMLPFTAGMLPRAVLTLPLANGYCAATRVVWPQGVHANAAEAESLIGRLRETSRRAYLAVRVKVHGIDAGNVGPPGEFTYASGDCRSEAQVTGLALYADEALTQKLHTFPRPKAVPPAASRTSATSALRPQRVAL